MNQIQINLRAYIKNSFYINTQKPKNIRFLGFFFNIIVRITFDGF